MYQSIVRDKAVGGASQRDNQVRIHQTPKRKREKIHPKLRHEDQISILTLKDGRKIVKAFFQIGGISMPGKQKVRKNEKSICVGRVLL